MPGGICVTEHVAPQVEESRPHTWLPQSALVADLRRNRKKIPKDGLYNVSFVYQNFARLHEEGEMLGPGTKLEKTERCLLSDKTMAEFPLVIELDAATTTFSDNITDAMQAGLVFDIDRFSPESIQDLGDRWVDMLEQVFTGDAATEVPLSSVVPLLPKELKLLRRMNQTATTFPGCNEGDTILDMIQKIAVNTPTKNALRINDEFLTYGEMWAKAVELATSLAKFNLGKDDVVCICMDRSFGLIIGILGIQLAGAAYCPIHPNEGGSRRRSILDLTKCAAVCVDQVTSKIFKEDGTACDLVDVNAVVANATAPSAERPVPVSADHAAYCVFTSGSTGKPKGVLVPHSALHNALFSRPIVKSNDVCMQFPRVTFDVHVGDIFCTLGCGAQLVLINEMDMLDFQTMARTLQDSKISHVQMVPSHVQRLFECIRANKGKYTLALKNFVMSGEKLNWEICSLLKEVLPPDCKIINLCGPAEATVDATICTVSDKDIKDYRSKDPSFEHTSCPIGKPLPNYTAYVLNPETKAPVAPGEEGELYLGGKGLFKGYLNQPDLAEGRLFPASLPSCMVSSDGDATPTLYSTGDIVKQCPSGDLVYTGRIDFQVKIRGQRVELGEIENQILANPLVKDVVCVMYKAPTAIEPQLTAHVVLEKDQESMGLGDVSDLYFKDQYTLHADVKKQLDAHCKDGLPSHMRPSLWVGMVELPLSQNLKVDRKQLPTPDANIVGGKRMGAIKTNVKARRGTIVIGAPASAAPLSSAPLSTKTTTRMVKKMIRRAKAGSGDSDCSSQLVSLWASTLGVDASEITRDSDFFAIGGSSLTAAQIVGQVRDTFCPELAVMDVFDNTEFGQMVDKINELNGGAGGEVQYEDVEVEVEVEVGPEVRVIHASRSVQSGVSTAPAPTTMKKVKKMIRRAKAGSGDSDCSSQLVSLWASTLGVDASEITRDSDFFAIGGSSLTAAQIVGQVRDTFCPELAVMDVFDNTEFGQMVDKINELNGGAGDNAGAVDEWEEVEVEELMEVANPAYVPKIAEVAITIPAASAVADPNARRATAHGDLAPVHYTVEAKVLGDINFRPQGKRLPGMLRHLFQLFAWLFMTGALGGMMLVVTLILRLTFEEYGNNTPAMMAGLLVGAVAYGIMLTVFALLVKWTVLGRVQPGAYRVWSPFFVRWWMVNNLVSMTNKFVGFFIQDTMFYPVWLRMFGARIGEHVVIDTTKIFDMDQIEIGAGTTIEGQASLHGHAFSVIDGKPCLIIAPIKIGQRCLLNLKVAVEPNTAIQDNVEIIGGSVVPQNTALGGGKVYKGAPPKATGAVDVLELAYRTDGRRSVIFNGATFLLQLIGMLLYQALWIAGFTLGLWPANEIYEFGELNYDKATHYYSAIALFSITPIIMLLAYCIGLVPAKWILVGCPTEGKSILTSFLYARHWLCNRYITTFSWILPAFGPPAMQMYLYRLMGLSYGSQCQATLANFSSCLNLVTLGDRVWLGANNTLLPFYYEGHYMVFRRINIKDGAVLSPNCVTQGGSNFGESSVLGPSSVVPANMDVPRGGVYMGNRYVMQKRGGMEPVRKAPAWWYIGFQVCLGILTLGTYALLAVASYPIARLFVDVIGEETRLDSWTVDRQNPSKWADYSNGPSVSTPEGLAEFYDEQRHCFLTIPINHWGIAFLPMMVTATLLLFTLLQSVIVRVIRRRKPIPGPEFFDRRLLLFLWEGGMIGFSLLNQNNLTVLMTKGTELIPLLMRICGAKVGKDVYWDGWQPTEYEMIEIGDETCVDQADVVVHGVAGLAGSHIFTQQQIKLGKRCVLRPGCYAIPPVAMGDNVTLCTNTIVNPGDKLNDYAVAQGNPAKVSQPAFKANTDSKSSEQSVLII